MKKFIYMSFSIALFTILSSCSAEEIVADTPSNSDDVYQRRIKALMAIDITTLFSYSHTEEVKSNMPSALSTMEKAARIRLQIPCHKGSTDAVYKIVLEGGTGKIWVRHLLDMGAGKMVDSSYKPEDIHNLHVLPREKYQETYNEVTDALASKYSNLGDYTKPGTVAALSDYLDKKISTANGSAELYIRVDSDSVQIYALQ